MRRGPGTIERIGARFRRPEAASAALRAIRRQFGVRDVEVRALGSTDYRQTSTDVLLARRFPAQVADDAIEALRGLGGVIVERRVEAAPGAREVTG